MDQGAARDRRHFLDGGHALSAAAFRLSLRGRDRLETVRDVQGDGTEIAEGDHESGHDRDVACGTLPCLGGPMVFAPLVARKTAAGGGAVRRPRIFCPLREGFCWRSESA